MRSVLDALLSMQKYTAQVMGAGWELRLAQDRGEITAGVPLAEVILVGDVNMPGSARFAELSQPMAVHLYPLPKNSTSASIIEASRAEEVLLAGFRMRGVGLGRPLRVPLYDYDGVADPLVSDSVTRFDHDFLSLLNFTTQLLPDGNDPRRIRVIGAFTARWRRTGLLARNHPVETVTTTWVDPAP